MNRELRASCCRTIWRMKHRLHLGTASTSEEYRTAGSRPAMLRARVQNKGSAEHLRDMCMVIA